MRSLAYILWTKFDGVSGLARLNGYPVGRGTEGDLVAPETTKLNHLLVDGANTLSITAWRDGSRETSRVVARLFRGRHGDADDVTPLFEVMVRNAELPPPEGPASEIARHTVHFDRAYGRWSWQDATPYANDDFAEVVALHRRVADAFTRRDAAAVVALFETKYVELARSVGDDPPSVLARNLAFWSALLGDPSARIEIATEGDLVATSWSDGRLVDVTRKDGRTPVAVIRGTTRLSVPYVVSKIAHRLELVR